MEAVRSPQPRSFTTVAVIGAGPAGLTAAYLLSKERADRALQGLPFRYRRPPLNGCVVRQPKAYPVYDEEYSTNVDVLRRELEERFPTLHFVGRATACTSTTTRTTR
jgi:protoporphyrinogen oxidase